MFFYWQSNVFKIYGLLTAAMDYTGFYVDPLSASVRTLGCGSTLVHEHLLVYWFGSLGGTLVGVAVQPTFARTVGY